jgi:hypothetical protein
VTRGKRTALAAGAAVGLILLALAAAWKDLVVAHRISELRGDPALIIAWLPEPGDSSRGTALRRYVGTAPGIEAVRRLCLAFAFDVLAREHAEFLPGALQAGRIIQLGIHRVTTSHTYVIADGPSTVSLPLSADEVARLGSEQALLGLATSGEFELAEYPGIRFTAWSYREDGEGRPPVFEAEMARHSPPPARAPDSSSPGAADTSRIARPPPTSGTE